MVASLFGFLGSIVGIVVAGIAAAAGITFFVVAWKAGVLPGMVEWVTTLISGALAFAGSFLGFLRELLSFAAA